MEEWRPIPGYDGYEASDLGRIRSVDRWVTQLSRNGKSYRRFFTGRILRPIFDQRGYPKIAPGRKTGSTHVHVLVMLTFRGPRPSGYWIAHNDGDEGNCRLSNLRYDTPSGNHMDKVLHGTDNRGDKHWRRRAAA